MSTMREWNPRSSALALMLATPTGFRGIVGGPAEIGADHQGIFDTIYRGSTIRYEVDGARVLGTGLVLAHGRATLDVPAGPMAGVHHALSTVVITKDLDRWMATAFHNTLVTA